jgi:hypothetical protein
LMYIQLDNSKHTHMLLEGASIRLPFLSYDPGLKATRPSRGTHLMRPVLRTGDGFPPYKFYHRHPPPPNISLNGQCNTPINFLGTLSCRKVLSFMVNCNSGPCYVFGTLKLATSLLTVRSLTDTDEKRAPTNSSTKIHFSTFRPVFNYYASLNPCDSSNIITITMTYYMIAVIQVGLIGGLQTPFRLSKTCITLFVILINLFNILCSFFNRLFTPL